MDDIYPELITIKEGCIITEDVKILTHFIYTKSLSNEKDYYFRFYQGNVFIEENVFIGTNTVIAKPCKIGKGSINCVVTKDIPENSLVIGNPCTIKKIEWIYPTSEK